MHETAEKGAHHEVDGDDRQAADNEGADRNVNEGADRSANEGADRNVNEAVSTELLTVVALIDKIDIFGRRPSLARPVLQVGPPQTCKAAAIFALIWGLELRVKRAMPSTPKH